MGLFKLAGRLVILGGAAFAGAVAGDVIRQRLTGEEGRILHRDSNGQWQVNVTPQLLIPGILAGFRSRHSGMMRAAGVAAFMSATGGKGLGGIAGSFFPKRQA